MSHLRERKEKDCLNCGAVVQGRFCHICGQENIETKESFWHLVTHFMYDITHFDGKFFSTLKYLLFRPGFLSHEYLRGRRADYLHPIRMYVFTSAFFFLIFFSFQKEDAIVKVNTSPETAAGLLKKLEKKKVRMQKALVEDSLITVAQAPVLASIQMIDSDIALLKRDTTAKDSLKSINENGFGDLTINGKASKNFRTIEAYDSAQNRLPASERDGFIVRRFEKQNIHLREKYHGKTKEMWTAILEKFKHFFPQMLFVSLPLFALALQLLYVRRKKFFYVNHVVYTIHLYCGTFIIILCSMALHGLFSLFNGKEPDWINGVITLLTFIFWYKSLRNFYEQRRGKTILKYFLILFLGLLIMAFVFTLFFIFSAMSI